MAIATKTTTSIQNAPGEIYLLAAPTTVVGTTTAAIVKELYGKIYTDGDIRGALASGVTPWAKIDKSGYKDKFSSKPIKIDPNDGPEETIGFESIEYSSEITIYDGDVDHLKDILSASAAEVLALTASATQAGRSTLLGGAQRFPSEYLLAYRFPSKKCPGEYITILIPRCTIEIEIERENSKAKARELKVKINALPFSLLLDPTTGLPVLWLEDFVTNPKTA